MTNKRAAPTNQQQNSEKPKASGILQRTAVRSVSDEGEQSTEEKEIQPLGNSALSNDLSRVRICTTKPQQMMAKLMIGPVGDKYEQEADRVASEVVEKINALTKVQSTQGQSQQPQHTADEVIERRSSCNHQQRTPEPTPVQHAAKRDSGLQAKSNLEEQDQHGGREASEEVESGILRARGEGKPLDASLQQSMGHAMGADFSRVKVHTDREADQLNEKIQAKAFTTGEDVFFRQGEYNPRSRVGQELIAHELTHVVQQNGKKASVRNTIRRAVPKTGDEMEKPEPVLRNYTPRTNNAELTEENSRNRSDFPIADGTRRAVIERFNPIRFGISEEKGFDVSVMTASGVRANINGVQLDHQISWKVMREAMLHNNARSLTQRFIYTIEDARKYANDIDNLIPELGSINAAAGSAGVRRNPGGHEELQRVAGLVDTEWLNLQNAISSVPVNDAPKVERIKARLSILLMNLEEITDKIGEL